MNDLPPGNSVSASRPIGTADAPPRIPAATAAAPGNRKILNTRQASVEYRIDQPGSSGVGKVEIYLTSDQGQTWQRLKEDVAKRSPVDIELPGEGLFGISVVVTNGNGFGGSPPKNGQQPVVLDRGGHDSSLRAAAARRSQHRRQRHL